MLALAARFDVHVSVVAGNTGGLQRVVGVFFTELLKTVVDLLGDDVALLEPALGTIRGAHFDETLLAVHHTYPIAVLDGAGFAVDRRHPVAQRRLRRRNIHDLEHASPASPASGQEQED